MGSNTSQENSQAFSSIVRLTKGVEMKPDLLSLIAANQFGGFDKKDPYNHLTNFYKLYGTMSVRSGKIK